MIEKERRGVFITCGGGRKKETSFRICPTPREGRGRRGEGGRDNNRDAAEGKKKKIHLPLHETKGRNIISLGGEGKKNPVHLVRKTGEELLS